MLLIYISGIDGCGKTTQAKRLVEWLRERGVMAEYQWLRWQPSVLFLLRPLKRLAGRGTGKASSKAAVQASENAGHRRWVRIKKRLLGFAPFRALWLAYAARDYARACQRARAQWKGPCVVTDRYLLDFIVDQALNLDLSIEECRKRLRRTPLERIREPDISILIDLPAQVGYERKHDGTPLAYLEARRACYATAPESGHLLRLDGTLPADAIHEAIREWVLAWMQEDCPQ